MNLMKAKEILKGYINKNDGLSSSEEYLDWNVSNNKIIMDGMFTLDELEAISYWMYYKNKSE